MPYPAEREDGKMCELRDSVIGCRKCVSNSKHICEQADANRFVEIPVYSEEKNEDGNYYLLGYCKKYVD